MVKIFAPCHFQQKTKSHASRASHMSHLQLAGCEAPRFAQCFTLHLSKLEALNAVFDCFWAAEVLLFALFSVEEIGAYCRWLNQPEMT